MPPLFDVFLSHNSKDKPAVREIAKALRARQLRVWLDEDDLVPGRPWQEALEEIIQTTKAAAVLVGRDGLGPWEVPEMRACLSEFVNRKLPVIPVLLPDAPSQPDLPLFLRAFTWVDLRGGITDEGLDRLVWGITGKKPRGKKKKPEPPPFLHNLPYLPLGDLLKGRAEELRKLAENLDAGGRTAIVQHQALYGLGGIGKTRLAVEHAWAFGSRYRAAFFVRADTPEGLHAGLAALARPDLLNLGEQKAEEETVHEVIGWLKTNPGWLLILDNVDSKEAESAVLTLLPGLTGGRVLITSRLRGWPSWVQTQPLDTIPLEEARDLLLKRTSGHHRAASDDADRAWELAEKLDGLPLALEQAGAYIVHTRLSFAKYLEVWEEERKRVLDWHDEATMGYPASVTATWKTSFDRLRPTAATLLRLCAFLAPDPIPEEMLESEKESVEGACELLRSETGQEEDGADSIHEALAELESYSLISRQEATFTVHRVVQEVLQRRIPPEQLRDWIEAALGIVDGYAPFEAGDVRTWSIWNWLRPHAARVVLLADKEGVIVPTSRLMSQLGVYLHARSLYAEAEPLKRRALAIDEAFFGSDHSRVAIQLNNLGHLLRSTNRLSEAEPLIRRALAIDEALFASEHPNVARDLNNLAALLQDKNRLAEAEPLMRRALAIDETSFGSEHPYVATDLSNLAQLLQARNRLVEAEPLMRRALVIDEASFGSDHPNVALRLNNLARLLYDTDRLSEAESLMRRALAIDEASFGSKHPNVARDLNNLAQLLHATHRLSEAEPLMRRALAIDEASFGSKHPSVARDLNNLAQLLQDTSRLSEAEPLMRLAVAIDEASLGSDHPNVAEDLNNLAGLLSATNRPFEAEPLMRRTVEICERSLGPDHPRTRIAQKNLAVLLAKIASQSPPPPASGGDDSV
jgi:tetratricopeptide (TPR) repeat protein